MTVLSRRALNRALLDRQLLLRRSTLAPARVIEHLVGMQAQAPIPPYFGLWSRLEGFRPEDLARLLVGREVVRMVVMRGTIHLVTADDALALRPLAQPIMDRDLARNATYAPPIAGMDLAALASAGRELLAEEPLTPKELGIRLRERWPDRDGGAMAYAVRNLLPLVQVPPRGLWGASGATTYATAESWLGRPLAGITADEMVLRYLAAFGPASVQDAQTWSGLTGLRAVFERLRPRLAVFRTEEGRELFDLPDAPRPDADTPAPVRLIAPFDNLVLSHADRSRVVSDEHRRRIFMVNGIIPGMVLLDGVVAGTWKLDGGTLSVELFDPPSTPDADALHAEATRLLAFAAPGSSDIRVTAPR